MPLQEGDISAVRLQQTAQFQPDGTIKRMISVEFKVREQGPFGFAIATDEFDAEVVQKMIRERAADIVSVQETI